MLSGQDVNLNPCNILRSSSSTSSSSTTNNSAVTTASSALGQGLEQLTLQVNKIGLDTLNGGSGFSNGGMLSYEKWSSAGDMISVSGKCIMLFLNKIILFCFIFFI
jgi:hypothetical protein